jgi:hypothetical protein
LFHNLQIIIIIYTHYDAPSHSLKDSNASLKVKNNENRRSWDMLLNSQHLRVEGHARALRWGLRRYTDSQDSSQLGLEGSHHLFFYNIFCD